MKEKFKPKKSKRRMKNYETDKILANKPILRIYPNIKEMKEIII